MSLRVLYISANGFPASSSDARGTFSLEHAQALRALGVHLDAVDSSRTVFGQDDVDGLSITRIPKLRGLIKALDLRGIIQYVQFFFGRRAASYDAVIYSFFYLKYLPLIFFLGRRNRVQLVIAHGGDVMPGGPLRSSLKRLMFRKADLVTPVSDFTEAIFSCLVRRRQGDNAKIVTIYNGVDFNKLRQGAGPNEVRSRLGIRRSSFVVLSICNLVRRKGLDILVRAVDALAAEGRDVCHVIVGRGPERERLEELARRGGNKSRFLFVDSVESGEIASFYEMADLFALVSITDWDSGSVEGFGITYAEAMALGTPVIGGGGSGTSTPIKHGLTGWLVDPYRPDVTNDVAFAIRRFMDDPSFYHSISESARRHVSQHFRWEHNASRTVRALELALQTRGIRPGVSCVPVSPVGHKEK